MTIEESISGMKRIVISVSSFVRVRTLDVLVRRQVRRHQVRMETRQAQNAGKNTFDYFSEQLVKVLNMKR